MSKRRTKSLFSLTTLLASFFGATMIAAAFAYFNYKFAEYKFIDFNDWVFYEKKRLFTPESDTYIVFFYSSKAEDISPILNDINSTYPILAIDMYQQTFQNIDNVHYLKAGSNTMLKFIQRFNIYEVPSLFLIKKSSKTLYKQDSMINKLRKIENLQKRIKNL